MPLAAEYAFLPIVVLSDMTFESEFIITYIQYFKYNHSKAGNK